MVAKSANDALLELYRLVSGNSTFSDDDICDEFSALLIDRPLMISSRIFGKVPSRKAILDNELEEPNIEELLREVL